MSDRDITLQNTPSAQLKIDFIYKNTKKITVGFLEFKMMGCKSLSIFQQQQHRIAQQHHIIKKIIA